MYRLIAMIDGKPLWHLTVAREGVTGMEQQKLARRLRQVRRYLEREDLSLLELCAAKMRLADLEADLAHSRGCH